MASRRPNQLGNQSLPLGCSPRSDEHAKHGGRSLKKNVWPNSVTTTVTSHGDLCAYFDPGDLLCHHRRRPQRVRQRASRTFLFDLR